MFWLVAPLFRHLRSIGHFAPPWPATRLSMSDARLAAALAAAVIRGKSSGKYFECLPSRVRGARRLARNMHREKMAVGLTFPLLLHAEHRHLSHSQAFQTLSALRNSGGRAKAAFDQRDREGHSALGRWRCCAPRAVATHIRVGIGRRRSQVHKRWSRLDRRAASPALEVRGRRDPRRELWAGSIRSTHSSNEPR